MDLGSGKVKGRGHVSATFTVDPSNQVTGTIASRTDVDATAATKAIVIVEDFEVRGTTRRPVVTLTRRVMDGDDITSLVLHRTRTGTPITGVCRTERADWDLTTLLGVAENGATISGDTTMHARRI